MNFSVQKFKQLTVDMGVIVDLICSVNILLKQNLIIYSGRIAFFKIASI